VPIADCPKLNHEYPVNIKDLIISKKVTNIDIKINAKLLLIFKCCVNSDDIKTGITINKDKYIVKINTNKRDIKKLISV
tara:strand:- start:960 stop:1196 length:237 start_codon:yes stop_codon:yes gene_type:complete